MHTGNAKTDGKIMIAAIPKDTPVEKTIEMLTRLQFSQTDMSEERIQELIKIAIDKTKESK